MSHYMLLISAQSVTASFGLPSSFSWLDKYHALIKSYVDDTPAPKQLDIDSGNPFENDVFDPFKYMNIATAQPTPLQSDQEKVVPGLWHVAMCSYWYAV